MKDQVPTSRETPTTARPSVASRLWTLRSILMSAIFGTLVVFAAVGYALDQALDTWPKVFVIAIILSFPVANYVAIKASRHRFPL